jgi:hypothetical protein
MRRVSRRLGRSDLDTFPSAMGIITRLACGHAKQEGVGVVAKPTFELQRFIDLACGSPLRDLCSSTTSPLVSPPIAAAMYLPTASLAAFTGSRRADVRKGL